ncbi:PREDICTED: uncharacterized protein LOC106806641 [Priapulus caudatus]|uniref:Uncharacterized protein LOC106806641 n=1 Tax=Priapulus caudatus TaxID=37621 RepID=A0ABM1DW11_PRICU|nr:PREDICTED: uncharacterized protein LOC106806641 [Priapulus caudatus]
MSKTSVPQRGYWSEPEEDSEPEPARKLTSLRVIPAHPASVQSEPGGGVEARRSIFENITTEEHHKKFTEDYDIKYKQVFEEAAPQPVLAAPQPRPVAPPLKRMHSLPHSGFMTTAQPYQQSYLSDTEVSTSKRNVKPLPQAGFVTTIKKPEHRAYLSEPETEPEVEHRRRIFEKLTTEQHDLRTREDIERKYRTVVEPGLEAHAPAPVQVCAAPARGNAKSLKAQKQAAHVTHRNQSLLVH